MTYMGYLEFVFGGIDRIRCEQDANCYPMRWFCDAGLIACGVPRMEVVNEYLFDAMRAFCNRSTRE